MNGLLSRRGAPSARARRASSRRPLTAVAFRALLFVTLAVALVFLTLPVAAIFVDVGPGELVSRLDDPASVDALRLSLETTRDRAGVIIVVGTPAAYLLATRSFRGRAIVLTLIELPLILPPAAAGIGLLAALGPNGIAGPALDALGIRLPLTTAGVVVALVFVSSPFYLRQATRHSARSTGRCWRPRAPSARPSRARSRASRCRSRCRRSRPARRSPGAARWGSSARR